MKLIGLQNITSRNEVTLEGMLYIFNLYFNGYSERWVMDIENKTSGNFAYGLYLNSGEDIVSSSQILGLQALVPMNLSGGEMPTTLESFMDDVKMMYMTLEEYNQYRYDGQAEMRLLWKT